MEVTDLALATVAALGPYLTNVGETAAKKIGEDLYNWLKSRFEKEEKKDSQTALEQLKLKPESEARRAVLVETITDYAKMEPEDFRTELTERIQQITSTKTELGTLVGQVISGKVAVVNTMYGNINM